MRTDRELCATYRQSLRMPRQLAAVIAYVVAALVFAQVLVAKSEDFEDLITKILWMRDNAVRDDEENRAREALGLIAKTVSGSPATSVDVVDRTMDMSIPTVIVLLAAVIFVAYLAMRMLVPAFRLKRQLLCLADQTEWGVRDCAAGWVVNKSVGAYARERAVFRTLASRPPAERPIDLLILAAPPVLLASISVGYVRFAQGDAYRLALAVWFLAAFALRVVWLYSCNQRRHAPADPGADDGREGFERIPPFVARGADGSRSEGRTVVGVAAVPVIIAILVPFLDNVVLSRWVPGPGVEVIGVVLILLPMALPWLVAGTWYRLATTTRRIEDMSRHGRAPRARRRTWVWMLLFPSVVLSPIAIARDIWRLSDLLADRSRRVWLRRLAGLGVVVPVLAVSSWVVLGMLWFVLDVAESGRLSPVYAVTTTFVVFGYGTILGAVQWAQNLLLPTYATMTPFGRCTEG